MSLFSSDIIHHFFKVYLPSHSSHNLKIPPTFIQKINGVIPGESILKDPLGRKWQVNVEKLEDSFYFQTGWREFVEANCLNLGDFIVFRFMGNSVFDVMIFDNGGCEKDNNLEDFGEVKEELKGIVEVKEELKQEHKEEEQEEDYEFPNALTNFVEPKHPYFIGYVKSNRPYDLHIPKAVVKDDRIVLKPMMELLDVNQNKWLVRISFRKDGRVIITKGWWAFWTGNNLTPHDKCIFEFKPDEKTGSMSNVIQVNIVRATPRM